MTGIEMYNEWKWIKEIERKMLEDMDKRINARIEELAKQGIKIPEKFKIKK